MSLTDAGNRFRDAVSAGLGIIHAAAWSSATLQSGTVVTTADGFVETGNTCRHALTEKAQGNPLARKCPQFFEGSA